MPNEITLAINISGCPCNCRGCHSSYLAEDIGEPLDLQHLTNLIDSNKGISCVCIMGGDANPSEVDDIAQDIKEYYPELKVGWLRLWVDDVCFVLDDGKSFGCAGVFGWLAG